MTVDEFYTANKKSSELPSNINLDINAFELIIEDEDKSWSPGTAQTLGTNAMVLGTTDYNYCDYYKIEVKEESTIVLYGGNISGEEDDLLYLYFTLVDESCKTGIAYDDYYTYDDTAFLGFTCTLQPGTYYLAVFADDDYIKDSLSYTFRYYLVAGTL